MKKDFFKVDVNFDKLSKDKYSSEEAKERVSSKKNFKRLFR